MRSVTSCYGGRTSAVIVDGGTDDTILVWLCC